MNAPQRIVLEPQDPHTRLSDLQGRMLSASFDRRFDLGDDIPAEREELSGFIQTCFAKAHGARVQHFMPRLLSLRDSRGELIAAFGLRPAAHSRLFLEDYLDAPIENEIASRFRRQVCRDDIIEVGNLSAMHAGATRWLIVAVTMLLFREGYRWIAFTGTNVVRNGLLRLGLRPHEICAAQVDRLAAQDRKNWGNYYDHSPTVMCGEIAAGYRSLLEDQRLEKVLAGRIDPGAGAKPA